MPGLDAVLIKSAETGLYDFQLDENGDILTADAFDTALLYSIYGERRASSDEVVDAQLRRGWIGNAGDFENGSKIWLLRQARLTRDILNQLEDEAEKALQWMVDDGLAVALGGINAVLSNGAVGLDTTIFRSRDKVVRRFFILWENTGNA